jgi:hypothetical protein
VGATGAAGFGTSRRRAPYPSDRGQVAPSPQAKRRRTGGGGAAPSSRNGRLAIPFLVMWQAEVPPPNLVMLRRRIVRRCACAFLALPRVLTQAMGMEGQPRGPPISARGVEGPTMR